MKAMILAAGLGTRLRPLTNDRPKAMVRIKGIPLLEIVIRQLKYFGVKDIIINTHHFADQITDFLRKRNHFGLNIVISHEADEPLETGGGLKKAAYFFEGTESFLLCNTDILTNLDLQAMYAAHQASHAVATLATRQRATSRYLVFDENDELCGWTNIKTGELKMVRPVAGRFQLRAFSGIHLISPLLFPFFSQESKFSIIDTYLEAARVESIRCYPDESSIWLDVGKPEMIVMANEVVEKLLGSDTPDV